MASAKILRRITLATRVRVKNKGWSAYPYVVSNAASEDPCAMEPTSDARVMVVDWRSAK